MHSSLVVDSTMRERFEREAWASEPCAQRSRGRGGRGRASTRSRRAVARHGAAR